MIGSFLRKIWGNDNKPDAMIFFGTGVNLLCEGSIVLDALDGISNSGVDLIACGTGIDYFKLRDKIKVGRISNMQDIVRIMMDSEKVINL